MKVEDEEKMEKKHAVILQVLKVATLIQQKFLEENIPVAGKRNKKH